MARFYKYFFFLTSCIILGSCQEGGDAGDLFGMWRLKNSEPKSISFAGSLVLFRDTNGSQIYGSFRHVSDSLFIQCVSVNASSADTTFIENDYGFKPFDNIRLKINTLNDDDLVLSKDGKTWSFYKY